MRIRYGAEKNLKAVWPDPFVLFAPGSLYYGVSARGSDSSRLETFGLELALGLSRLKVWSARAGVQKERKSKEFRICMLVYVALPATFFLLPIRSAKFRPPSLILSLPARLGLFDHGLGLVEELNSEPSAHDADSRAGPP